MVSLCFYTAAQSAMTAFCPEPCCSALVSSVCTPVRKANLDRFKCSGTRLLPPCFAQSTEHQGIQQTLNPAAVHWCPVNAHLYEKLILIGSNAVAQDCCHLVLHSTTEHQGMHFALNPAAVHWCLVNAHLYEKLILIGSNAVAQNCCHLVLHSSTEHPADSSLVLTAITPLKVCWTYRCTVTNE